MLKTLKILFASFVGLLVFFGGISKFHHHLDETEVCFCSGLMSGYLCDHHHDDSDDQAQGSHADRHGGNDTEDSCPLHLDSFIVTDTQHIDLPSLCCHHNHCDLCAPLAYCDDSDTDIIIFDADRIPLLTEGHSVAFNRRGPPVC